MVLVRNSDLTRGDWLTSISGAITHLSNVSAFNLQNVSVPTYRDKLCVHLNISSHSTGEGALSGVWYIPWKLGSLACWDLCLIAQRCRPLGQPGSLHLKIYTLLHQQVCSWVDVLWSELTRRQFFTRFYLHGDQLMVRARDSAPKKERKTRKKAAPFWCFRVTRIIWLLSSYYYSWRNNVLIAFGTLSFLIS